MTADLPEIRRVGGYIGAEIRGLDLARDYPDATYAAVALRPAFRPDPDQAAAAQGAGSDA